MTEEDEACSAGFPPPQISGVAEIRIRVFRVRDLPSPLRGGIEGGGRTVRALRLIQSTHWVLPCIPSPGRERGRGEGRPVPNMAQASLPMDLGCSRGPHSDFQSALIPSPLRGGPGWGCRRLTFIGYRSHPHLPLLPTASRVFPTCAEKSRSRASPRPVGEEGSSTMLVSGLTQSLLVMAGLVPAIHALGSAAPDRRWRDAGRPEHVRTLFLTAGSSQAIS
jgi:hypothetical protein